MDKVEAQVFNTSDIGGEPLRLAVEKTHPTPVSKEQQAAEGDPSKVGVRPWQPMRVAPKDLLQFFDMNVWHRRSIKVKGAVICGLGWGLVTDDENKSEDDAYRQIMALLESPSDRPSDTFAELNTRLMVDYLSMGNGYLEVSRDMKGRVANLYHTRSKTVRRDRNLHTGGYWQGLKATERSRRFNNFGQRHIHAGRNEMLQYYSYDPNSDYYGIPGWYPALADMLMDRSIAEYYINLFENQMMAQFAIIVEGGKLSKAAMKSVKNYVKHNYSGIDQAGKTIVLNSESKDVKIKIEKLNVDFGSKSYGISNLREENRDFVLSAHGVPPRMVGVVSQGQLGGGGEVTGQLKTFKETEIDPAQSRLEDFYNNTVLASFGPHKWRLEFTEMDVTDKLVDAKYWTHALNPKTGWAVKDQAREAQGMEPLEEDEQADPTEVVAALSEQVEAFRKSLDSVANYEPVL